MTYDFDTLPWVLKHNDLYFETWVAIGPLTTKDRSKAMEFQSKQAAQSEADRSWKLTMFDAVQEAR